MSEPENVSFGFFSRLGTAAANMFVPLHTAVILIYIIARQAGWTDFVLVQTMGYVLPWLFLPLLVLLPLAFWQRSRAMMAATAVSSLIFLILYGRLFLPHPAVDTTDPTFTVMTYNVFYRNEQVEDTLAEILARDPDVLALHEYLDETVKKLDPALSAQYPYSRVEEGRGFYSRLPFADYQYWAADEGDLPGMQQATVNVNGREVVVISAHLQAPTVEGVAVGAMALPISMVDTGDHTRQIEAVIDHVRQIDAPLALVGDFNMTDRHPAYAELTAVLEDSFIERGNGFGFTFTPFKERPLPFWRIDYVLHSPELTAVDVIVGNYAGSDHKPLIVTLAVPETAVIGETP